MKLQDRLRAIDLRKSGNSYRDILKVVDVSKSTLSIWLRDIELTPEQKIKLITGQDIGRMKASKNRQRARIEKTERIIAEAKKELSRLSSRPLFLPGLMLYWAEGAKHNGEHVQLVNSDPAMIQLMMRWFREICRVPEYKFRISLHIHSLHCRKDMLSF